MAARPPSKKTPVRVDPPPQEDYGFDPMKIEILNRDPDREYVLALDAEIHGTGVAWYEALGWDIEYAREGGPTIRGARTKRNADGKPVTSEITYLGNVLMSCPREHFEKMEQFGVGGRSGQRRADIQEKLMLNGPGMVDSFRGGDRKYRNVGHGVQNTSFMRVSEADGEDAFPTE